MVDGRQVTGLSDGGGFSGGSNMGRENYSGSMAYNQGDIILKPDSGRVGRNKLLLIILGILVTMIVVLVVVILVVRGRTDGGVTDGAVLELTEDSYVKIASIQSNLVDGRSGEISAEKFFTEDAKGVMEGMLTDMQGFNDSLERYNPNLISDEYARENFLALKKAVANDMVYYVGIVDLYELFYDYVNSGYNPSIATQIMELDNEGAIVALNNLDAIVAETGNYEGGTIVVDLFNAALGEDYPEVYYYQYIGNIIAGLRDE